MDVIERFLNYTKVYTKSDPETDLVPSTPAQMAFAKQLSKELMLLGLEDVMVDDNGYVMATLPSNCEYDVPVIGFISHMDTSPDCRGKGVKPQIFKNYQGDDLILNKELKVVLSPHEFPELSNYIGDDIITASGKTLLGADDKAGIAEIISAMEYLLKHDEIKHGKIRIAFTPDEEIGKGADKFDVSVFGAKWAYTIDGGEVGELEYENFNAASATVVFNGRNVHPGYAKHKMKNSIRTAHEFISMIPRHETPEHTEGYEGFYHLLNFHGDVENTTLNYIIRDHDKGRFESRKKEMLHFVNKINSDYGNGSATIEIKDQYYNMLEKIYPDNMHIVDLASFAMKQANLEAKIVPVRGGTDGSLLSYKGLPCPNIFTGGHNFHGRYEYIPVSSIKKAVEVIINICEIQAKMSMTK